MIQGAGSISKQRTKRTWWRYPVDAGDASVCDALWRSIQFMIGFRDGDASKG